MKKVQSLFKRDYEGTRQVYDEVVEGSEWVLNGEGIATIKWDGTCCMIRDGVMYKRYDRKLTKQANRKKKKDSSFVPTIDDFKPCPKGWEAAEDSPNIHTGHWPGWLLVDFDKPENKWHKEGYDYILGFIDPSKRFVPEQLDGSYELVGEKVQGNPYNMTGHELWAHGEAFEETGISTPPRTYYGLAGYLSAIPIIEGIVWHHPDGRMVKIKRSDFGYDWPIEEVG